MFCDLIVVGWVLVLYGWGLFDGLFDGGVVLRFIVNDDGVGLILGISVGCYDECGVLVVILWW